MYRTPVSQELVLAEVSLLVAAAVEREESLSPRREAAIVRSRHPDCPMREDEIAALIAQLAEKRGLPVAD